MSTVEDESSTSTVLKAAQVPLISSNVCNSAEVYGNELNSDSMICAGYLEGGTDACRGDSGGPLACKVGGKEFIYLTDNVFASLLLTRDCFFIISDEFQLLGLVSWGTGCGNINKPGVYTKVSYFNFQVFIFRIMQISITLFLFLDFPFHGLDTRTNYKIIIKNDNLDDEEKHKTTPSIPSLTTISFTL